MIKYYTNKIIPILFFPLLIAGLSGCGKLVPTETEIKLNENWFFRNTKDTVWFNANVPGTVHTDLLENNLIADPFYRNNERKLQWIDKNDWEYKTEFNLDDNLLSKEIIELQFDGLDTYSKIFLNGKKIAETDNMFKRYIFECKKLLKKGRNKLIVRFESPIKIGLMKSDSLKYEIPVSDNDRADIGEVRGNKRVSIFSRKSAYHFGWDWGPRFVTSGIWKPVKLTGWNNFKIKDLYIKQKSLGTAAYLLANIEINSTKNNLPADLEISVNGKTVKKINCTLNDGDNYFAVPFKIEKPELWWPNGMGKQNLYDIEVILSADNFRNRKKQRIGLRKVELINQPDSIGTSFYFRINGKPMYVKGANIIPLDVFLPRITVDKYNQILTFAKNANMNMLRVWGGGIYENNEFYNKCDELGILVWQDFMFTVSMLPDNEKLLKTIRQEAIDNVKRLRNHPSLALWCGNNEILDAWLNWGWKKQTIKNQSKETAQKIWKTYKKIFHEILPTVVKKYDSLRTYWPTSPGNRSGGLSNTKEGDMHYWGVWWGQEPFEKYSENIPRFMSEFGFQSFPEFNSVKKFTLPEDYNIYSDVMKSHQRSNIGNKTIEKYMSWYFNEPEDFKSYLYVSQLLQAYGVGYGIEVQRRNKTRCMGTLYWQLNDCWPAVSWSSIDYYGKQKALYYEVKKAYKNVLISVDSTADNIELFIVSDSIDTVNAKLTAQLIEFNGSKLKNWEKEITIPPNSSNIYLTMKKCDLYNENNSKSRLLSCKLFLNGREIANKLFYFVPFKNLLLQKPDLRYSVSEKDKVFEISISTKNLAKNVYLSSVSENNFTENYFDMLPNTKRTVRIAKNNNESLSQFKNTLKVTSLYETYRK